MGVQFKKKSMYKFTVTYFISAWCQPLISIYTHTYIPSHQRFSTCRVLGQCQTWLMQIFWFFSSFYFRHFYWIFYPREFVTCALSFLLNVPILSDTVAMEHGEKIIGYVFIDLISVHVNQSSFCTCTYKAHTELMNLPNQIKLIETHKLGFNKCLCYNSLYTFFCFRMYITIQSIIVQLNRLLFIQLNWEENMNLNKDSNTYFQVWWEHKCYQWTMSQLVKPVLSNLSEHKLDSTYTHTELHKFITIFCGL